MVNIKLGLAKHFGKVNSEALQKYCDVVLFFAIFVII